MVGETKPEEQLGTRSCMKNHKKINQRKYSELKEPLFTIVHEITLPQANQNKTTRRAGYKKVYEKKHPPKEAFRIKGALWNAGQNKNAKNNS